MNNGAEPIRVFHLIKSLGRGGAEMLLPEGLRFANRARFDYRYGYFLPWKDAMVASIREQGAEVTCFGGRNNAQILLSAMRVAALLREQRIDVLHCHLPVAGAVGRIAGKLAGVPVVYSEHNKQERYHRATRYLNRLTWRWQSRAVAVSGDVADSIRAHIHTDVPVDVVLNGVDVDRFRRNDADAARVRAQHGIPATSPVVGSVAVFRVQKSLPDWVEAARLIHQRHPDVHFLFVGDGPLRDEMRAAVSESGLDEVFHLPGLLEEVRPYLSAMDVYMMSSIFEGLPVALLEAMSMECTPVCTSVGGIPELVRSGENGVLTPPREPQALARAVGELIDQPERRRTLAENARAEVIARFSMRRMTEQLEESYVQIVQQHRNGR